MLFLIYNLFLFYPLIIQGFQSNDIYNHSLKKGLDNKNPYRVREVNESLHEIYQVSTISPQDLLSNLCDLIGTYDYDNNFQDLFEQIMNELRMFKNKGYQHLNLYNENFIEQFYQILLVNKKIKSFPPKNLFWYKLSRLVFKWTIYMKQKTATTTSFNSKNNNFKKISKSLELIGDLIYENGNLKIPSSFKLKNLELETLTRFKHLLYAEFLEHSYLFHSFVSVIKYFYKTNETNVSCEELKNDCFDGNYESNILLKYLIVMYDPKGEMRACIIKDDDHSSALKYLHSVKMITREYLERLKIKGPKNLEIISFRYISKPILQFYLSTNRKFHVDGAYCLVHLLKLLKTEIVLTKEVVENLFEFKFNGKVHGWDQRTFKRLVKRYKSRYVTQLDEQTECDEYLKLFKESSFISKFFNLLNRKE